MSDTRPSNETRGPARSRCYQFRLRTLLLFVTLVGALLLALRLFVEPLQQQRKAKELTLPVRLFPFCEECRWGYINRQGEVIVPPRYVRAYDFRGGLARAETETGLEYIDERGKLAFTLPAGIDWALDFADGMAAFRVNGLWNGKWGYLDRQGKVVVQPTFDMARDFSEGLAPVNAGAKWVKRHPEDRLSGGKWGFIDKAGRLVIPHQFDYVEIRGFSDGLAQVTTKDDLHFKYIDKTGQVVVPLEYKSDDPKRFVGSAHRFSEGLASVDTSGAYSGYEGFTGFIDKTGNFAIKPQFDGASDFSEGLAIIVVNKKSGYIDRSGRIVITPQYEGTRDFCEGLAAVLLDNAWRYIDENGNVIISSRGKKAPAGPLNEVEDFSGGLARVHIGGKFVRVDDGPSYWSGGAWFYVNRDGEVVRRAWRDKDVRPSG